MRAVAKLPADELAELFALTGDKMGPSLVHVPN